MMPTVAGKAGFKVNVESKGDERREHRRHDLEQSGIAVERWDGKRRVGKPLGKIVDISAGGVRIRTTAGSIRPDQQIRVRLELPAYAGISPFIESQSTTAQPRHDWVGWMTIARVMPIQGEDEGKEVDVAGRLVDMDEMDRGMLGLYLSTQPLAA